MSRWARARDANELDIVKALCAAGASVQHTYGTVGEPDLIVGYNGANYLIEVKNPDRNRTRGRTKATDSGTLLQDEVAPGGEFYGMDPRLSRRQARWHKEWKGGRPALVEYGHDALEHIGAPKHFCRCVDCVADAVLPGGDR